MLKLACGPKMAAIPHLGVELCLFCLACAGAVGVARCSWIAWSRDGILDFTRGLPPWISATKHHCDKWLAICINLILWLWWLVLLCFAYSQKWISIAAKISGCCGNFLQFMWCGYCLQFQFILWGWSGIQTCSKNIKQSYLKSARDNGQHPFKRVDSGHLDANVCVSLEPQQVLDRCTAWRMWPIATARKRRRSSSFTLKLVWENGSWKLPFALCFLSYVFQYVVKNLVEWTVLSLNATPNPKQGTKLGSIHKELAAGQCKVSWLSADLKTGDATSATTCKAWQWQSERQNLGKQVGIPIRIIDFFWCGVFKKIAGIKLGSLKLGSLWRSLVIHGIMWYFICHGGNNMV